MTLAPLAPPQPNVATGGVIPTDIVCFTPTGAGTMDGTSWANAMAGTQTNIQSAIDNASTTGRNRLLFWEGTYYAIQISLTNSVRICGGFNDISYDVIDKSADTNSSEFYLSSTSSRLYCITYTTGGENSEIRNIKFTGSSYAISATSRTTGISVYDCDAVGKSIAYTNGVEFAFFCYITGYRIRIFGNSITVNKSKFIIGCHLFDSLIYGNYYYCQYATIMDNSTLEACKIYGNFFSASGNSIILYASNSKNIQLYNNYQYRRGGDVFSMFCSSTHINGIFINNFMSTPYFTAWGTLVLHNCFFVNTSCGLSYTGTVTSYNCLSNFTIPGTKNNCIVVNADQEQIFISPCISTYPTAKTTGAGMVDVMATPETCTDEYWRSLHNADWRLKSNEATEGGQTLNIGVVQSTVLVDADGLDRGVIIDNTTSPITRNTTTAVGAYVSPAEKV